MEHFNAPPVWTCLIFFHDKILSKNGECRKYIWCEKIIVGEASYLIKRLSSFEVTSTVWLCNLRSLRQLEASLRPSLIKKPNWSFNSSFFFNSLCRRWFLLPRLQSAMSQWRRGYSTKYKFRHEMFSLYMSGKAPEVVLLTTQLNSTCNPFLVILFFVQKSPAVHESIRHHRVFKKRSPH